MSDAIAHLFDFERPRSRQLAFILLLVAAVLSPNIDTPGSFPAVRGEQALLAAFLPSLALYYWRNPSLWRIGFIDAAFVALGRSPAAALNRRRCPCPPPIRCFRLPARPRWLPAAEAGSAR